MPMWELAALGRQLTRGRLRFYSAAWTMPRSFLYIRPAQGARRTRSADEPGKHDHCEDVGNNLNVFHTNVRNDTLHLDSDGFRKTEKQACQHRLNRTPLAENQSSQGDESAASCHVSGKQRRLSNREICPSDGGQRAGE